MKTDIVRELIERLLEAAAREGTFTESVALEVERSFRRDYAGEAYYVKRLPIEMRDRQKAVTEAYLQGVPSEEIEEQNGISRATIYRYLKR